MLNDAIMLLQVDTRRIEPDIMVMTLTGKITMGRECQKVEQTMQDLLKQNERKVILDISAVDHIDSTGIGILAFCFGAVSRSGGALRVVGAGGKVLHVLQITRLTSVLPLSASIDAACQSMGASAAG
jgi:anti-sigma B factor antagonist